MGLVDSFIGKLRVIFVIVGRGNLWNDVFGVGNLVVYIDVKKYFKVI